MRGHVARHRLAPVGVVVALLSGCSLIDLDYLDTGADPGAAGAAEMSSAGRSVGSSGGETSKGGVASVAQGGASDEPRSGSGGRSGQEGGQNNSPGGSPDVDQAGAGAGGGGGGGGGGEPSTGPSVGYGIDGQSCSGGLVCPGGKSCCRRLAVPAGSYAMGTNSDAQDDEKPPHTTTLSAFELDEFEVTVGRLRRFVEAYDGTLPASGTGAHPKVTGSGWQTDFTAQMPPSRGALEQALSCSVGTYQTWTTLAGVRENMPANCVSWYVAFAFCAWDGGRLPTEAEWEKASAGGDEERLYPWGPTAPVPATHAVFGCQGDGVVNCSPSDVLAVGSRSAGAGRFGHQDLAGSLWEWTLDHYDATYYQSIGTCTDCANLAAATPRVLRGGNFASKEISLRATGRASKAPGAIDAYAGFRCARSL